MSLTSMTLIRWLQPHFSVVCKRLATSYGRCLAIGGKRQFVGSRRPISLLYGIWYIGWRRRRRPDAVSGVRMTACRITMVRSTGRPGMREHCRLCDISIYAVRQSVASSINSLHVECDDIVACTWPATSGQLLN